LHTTAEKFYTHPALSGCIFKHFLPHRFVYVTAEEPEPEHRKKLKKFFAEHSPDIAFGESHQNWLVTPKIGKCCPPVAAAASKIEAFISTQVKYLGPLRATPQTVYPLTDYEGTPEVGILGENTASVLHLFKDKGVCCRLPNEIRTAGLNGYPLKKAVAAWLSYLDIAEEVKTEAMGKLGYKLLVKLSGADTYHDLASVGVGVSQVLPIVVMCLIANVGSTLLFEQPELHLHPAVQSRLGDFFASLAIPCGSDDDFGYKQCIIETHSEYIIDRLRYRIVSDPSAKDGKEGVVSQNSAIYFAETKNGSAEFQRIEINKYGNIANWPKGFFDESVQMSDLILDAAMKKHDEEATCDDE